MNIQQPFLNHACVLYEYVYFILAGNSTKHSNIERIQ